MWTSMKCAGISNNAKNGFDLSGGMLYLVSHFIMGIFTIVYNSVGLMKFSGQLRCSLLSHIWRLQTSPGMVFGMIVTT